jgi:hypothetical protein
MNIFIILTNFFIFLLFLEKTYTSTDLVKIKKFPFHIIEKKFRDSDIMKYIKNINNLDKYTLYNKTINALYNKGKIKINENGRISIEKTLLKACKLKCLYDIEDAIKKYNNNLKT